MGRSSAIGPTQPFFTKVRQNNGLRRNQNMAIEKLKRLIDLGMAKSAIAKGVGVGPNAIGRWANGEATPSIENMIRLEQYIKKLQTEVA